MDTALWNIVAHLQKQPFAYRHFGPYWWRVKAMLKAADFDQGALAHLGPNDEAVTRERYAEIPDEDFLPMALAEQIRNAQGAHLSSWVVDPDTGHPYWIYDEDVGR